MLTYALPQKHVIITSFNLNSSSCNSSSLSSVAGAGLSEDKKQKNSGDRGGGGEAGGAGDVGGGKRGRWQLLHRCCTAVAPLLHRCCTAVAPLL
jgi:hypothetical protein